MTLDTLQAMPLKARTQEFLSWLRAQPATATYLPGSRANCALAQFGRTFGYMAGGMFSIGSRMNDGGSHIAIIPTVVPTYGWTDRLGFSEDGDHPPQTFHAFADHIEQSLETATLS